MKDFQEVGKLREVMEKFLESHGISEAQKSTNPYYHLMSFSQALQKLNYQFLQKKELSAEDIAGENGHK